MSVRELDSFTRAYIDCALWSSLDDDGDTFDDCTIDDIAAEALALMVQDCENFQRENEADLERPEYDGHDFWLTRNGHGAGFWDRGYGARGDRLTRAAKGYGEQNLYVGDDGKLYVA